MKNRLKYLLFMAINLILVICILEGTISSVSAATNIIASEDSKSNEEMNTYSKKEIYLTFDDGPSYQITNKVLDVLKEKDVKATFFVIGSQIADREDTLKRINNEGHSIGLHTFTHKYKTVYSSEDRFIKEMFDCQNEINRVIGISPNIIRFPGGSYKHLSKNYLNRLHKNNFKVYDWNLDIQDGLNPNLPKEKLYRKAVASNNLESDSIILLMHCTDLHKNTPKALPKIIDYYKSEGYDFKVITEETPEKYFRMVKS